MMGIHSIRAGMLAAALACPATVMALEVSPSITLGEIYTTNVSLEPSDEADSDWITRIAPRLVLGYQGNRLDFDIDYTLEALLYAEDSDHNEVYNQLSANGLLDLIGEELQLRAQASMGQVNVSPEKPVSNSNINTTGNRSDATIWNVGPQWRVPVFGSSEFNGHLWLGEVNYDAAETQDVKTTNGAVSLRSRDNLPQTFTYEAAYEYDNLRYDITGDSVMESVWLQLGYQINETYQVFVLGGLDSDFEQPEDPPLDQGRWEVGASAAFPADSVRVSVGHRFFGSTYSLDWDHQSGSFTYGLSYSDSPSTSDLNTLQEIPVAPPGTTPPPPPPDSGIGRPGNAIRYVRRRADADIAWELYRGTLSFNAFWENREDQSNPSTTTPGEVTPLNDETSYGANASFRWELGTHTDATLAADWTHQELNDLTTCENTGDCGVTDRNELYTLRAELDHDLGLRTSLQFETGYRTRQGTSGDQGDYDEFWASAQLLRTF